MLTANEVLLIAGMTLVTVAIRYPALALVGKIPLPDRVFRALRYVPPAVLTAIIIPVMLFSTTSSTGYKNLYLIPAMLFPSLSWVNFDYKNSYLVAGIIAALVSWRSRNLLLTIVLGMLALWG